MGDGENKGVGQSTKNPISYVTSLPVLLKKSHRQNIFLLSPPCKLPDGFVHYNLQMPSDLSAKSSSVVGFSLVRMHLVLGLRSVSRLSPQPIPTVLLHRCWEV